MANERPSVVIDPAMLSGTPCISGRRIPVYMVADMVWHNGVDEAMHMWALSREEVLVACWYAASIGTVHIWGNKGLKRQPTPWPRRWGAWADDEHGNFWRQDYDQITDPPKAESS